MRVIRCSSTDRVIKCASSLVDTDAPYTPNNPEAIEGTAAHKASTSISRGELPDIDGVAAEFGVDADVLAKLMHYATQAWDSVQSWLPGERLPELSMSAELSSSVVLRGTTDLLAVSTGAMGEVESLGVLDWKFGWNPNEHPTQVRSYAYLARERYGMPASGYVLGVEVWVRAGEVRVHKFATEDLDRLRFELLEQVQATGKQYGPSATACLYCPRQLECRARAEWLRSGVTALEPLQQNAPVTPELIGGLYERRRMLGAALKRYDEVLDGMLARGPVPLPGGAHLVIEQTEQDSIRPSKAMPFLRNELQLTPDEADEVLSVTKSGIQRVVKARAPHGQGAAAMRAAMQRLGELGAVEKVVKREKVIKGEGK